MATSGKTLPTAAAILLVLVFSAAVIAPASAHGHSMPKGSTGVNKPKNYATW